MRLSCNFVNVYTIAYGVQYTFTRVHVRIPNGQPREEKSVARVSVESADKSSRLSVSVSLSVSVPWNLSLSTPNHLQPHPHLPPGKSVSFHQNCTACAIGPTVENMTSSTKPEVHSTLYNDARGGGPDSDGYRQQAQKIDNVYRLFPEICVQTDGQTDRHAHHNTALRPGRGAEYCDTVM